MLDTRCCLLSVVQSTVLLDGMCPEINTVLGLQARNFLCETKLLRLGMWVKADISGLLPYWCSVHIVGWTTYSLCLEGGLKYWQWKLLSSNREKQQKWTGTGWSGSSVTLSQSYVCTCHWTAVCFLEMLVEINTTWFFYLPWMLCAVRDGSCWAVPSPGLRSQHLSHTKLHSPTQHMLLQPGLLLLWNKCCLNRKCPQPTHFSCAERFSSSSVQPLKCHFIIEHLDVKNTLWCH